MKRFRYIIIFWLTAFTYSQAQTPPQAFNYNAVARNASGQTVVNSSIGIRFSINQGTSSGSTVYSETHAVTTDNFGLFNLEVGKGTPLSGSFNTINWSIDKYFLKVDMDINGGTNYITMGTTELLSVPFAMHARTAEFVTGATHYVGEEFGGGVVFHTWLDNLGVQHGLIVDIVDLSTPEVWSNNTTTVVGASSTWDGLSNSILINTGAAALCLNSTNGGQSDWYLPSIDELNLLWNNRFNVNKTLSTIGGATILPEYNQGTFPYWSSTESNAFSAWNFYFSDGTASSNLKTYTGYVRAVRAF